MGDDKLEEAFFCDVFFLRCFFNLNCFSFIFTGAAAASRLYVDAISKLAKQAQQGTWGGSSDIGE